MSVTAALSGNLQLTDNVLGDTTFLKNLILSYAGTVSSFAQNYQVGTGGVNISLPTGNAQFLYVRNLSTVAGTQLNVSWVPAGGSLSAVLTLSPGSALLFSETDAVNGIILLNLTASAANTPVEYLLAS